MWLMLKMTHSPPNRQCPLQLWQQGRSSGPPGWNRFWYCPWSLCFSQHYNYERLSFKYQEAQMVPVDATSRTLVAGSGGEGGGRQARGVWSVRTLATTITHLVQVVHLQRSHLLWFFFLLLFAKLIVAYRLWHLWKGPLLQWVLSRHYA